MTDYLTDTPNLARMYCPDCEPDADPSTEILDVRRCAQHTNERNPVGADDAGVRADSYLSGSTEAGGEDNRKLCELIHRSRRDG